MDIKIITIGKIKEKYINEGINIFIERIKHYSKIEIIELKETNNKSIKENIILETNTIINKINNFYNYQVIILDIKSKIMDSINFSEIIRNNKDLGTGKILFVIGGSNGFSKEIYKSKFTFISFGRLTFPHQIFRMILLEQIYRSFKIISNEEYHK